MIGVEIMEVTQVKSLRQLLRHYNGVMLPKLAELEAKIRELESAPAKQKPAKKAGAVKDG